MKHGLELQGLTVAYGSRKVLDGLTLPVIAPGAMVALVGPNAVGKSTLLRAVAGLVASRGTVRLDGEDLAALPPVARLRRVGYLPQALPQPSSLVAYEAVLAALRASGAALPAEGIEPAVEAVFETLGLQPLALRRLDELSGGQRRMVGLAQVLVREPPLLLLDEPTSALDLRWQLRVLQGVRARLDAARGIALVAVHDLNLALRFCDLVIVLGPSGLIGCGAPAELLTPEVIASAYGVRARVERCSLGHPLVLVDDALPPSPQETPG